MEENFFYKRLTKKQAVLKAIIIIVLDIIFFFGVNSLHNFENVPLTFILAVISLFIFMYGIYTISAPFNYETAKKYLEKQEFKFDTPKVFIYKKYLVKWGKEGAYLYQKNGICIWVIYDIIFNTEDEVKDYIANKYYLKRKNRKGKAFYAIPYTGE